MSQLLETQHSISDFVKSLLKNYYYIATIEKWTIFFNYSFASTFYTEKFFKDAYLQLKDFSFEIELAFVGGMRGHYLQILAINLQLGDSSLNFGENPPRLFANIAYLFNVKSILHIFVLSFSLEFQMVRNVYC